MTPLPSDVNYLISLNDDKPTTKPPHLISEYIEGRRVLPTDNPFPGPVELWRSQYAVEIMDCFSPYNQTRYIDFMSAAQVVKTFIIEGVIGYGIGPNPSSMLYMSGTKELLAKWQKRLEPLIDSLGLRDKLHASSENINSRITGDKAVQKLFTGGFLEMASAQSPSSMRSDSVKILFLDEVDSCPPQLTTGEGRFDHVAEARTKQWESRKKIGAFSTPTLYDISIIYDRFLLGDQCQYFMPCPLCGKFQILESIQDTQKSVHGLKAETKAGELQYVYYICDYCHDAIFEHHKNSMIPAGRWEPKTKPEKFRRSFQINSLYAIWGGYSWISYWLDYQTAISTPDGLRNFTNLVDGMPYREKGSNPKVEKVIELRGNYKQGTVKDHVLWLTMAVDTQRGSEKNAKKPARLEIEVLGHSSKYRTASVLYKVFPGSIDDPFSGAWEDLHQWALKNKLEFKRKDGKIFRVNLVFVDSGDGEYTDIVYQFTGRWGNTHPIKGFKDLTQRKKEKGDEATRDNFMRYRATLVSDSITLYTISTNYYKRHIYNALYMSIKAIQENNIIDRAGFCDFPREYPDKYFDGLTVEELRRDGSFHCPEGRENEPLDLRVYNQCAGDVYLDSEVKKYKLWAKEKEWTKSEIDKIDTKFILRDMEKTIWMKKS